MSSSPSARQKSWFPLAFNMGINEPGELIVQSHTHASKPDQEEEEEEQQQDEQQAFAKHKVKRMYALHAVLCQIDDGTQKNLVSLINVRQKYHAMKSSDISEEDAQNQWYIFNDFRYVY